jgi:hypothetical protein
MKTWQRIKSSLESFWQPLDNEYMNSQQKKRDVRAFLKVYDKFLKIVYILFGMFSLISIYFFTTRVIF